MRIVPRGQVSLEQDVKYQVMLPARVILAVAHEVTSYFCSHPAGKEVEELVGAQWEPALALPFDQAAQSAHCAAVVATEHVALIHAFYRTFRDGLPVTPAHDQRSRAEGVITKTGSRNICKTMCLHHVENQLACSSWCKQILKRSLAGFAAPKRTCDEELRAASRLTI